MPVTACPTRVIRAPREEIWPLVATTAGYGKWADAEVIGARTEAQVVAGQLLKLETRALGLRWPVEFAIGSVRPMHEIHIDISLPLGVVNHETITLAELSEFETRVTLN